MQTELMNSKKAKSPYHPCTQAAYCLATCPATTACFCLPATCGMASRRLCTACGLLSGRAELPSSRASIFFEGCGFAFGFGLGVAKHMLETYDTTELDVYSISAGCLSALSLALQIDPFDLLTNGSLEKYLKAFIESTPTYGTFGTLASLAESLDDWLPHDAHATCSGKLRIIVSSWPCLGFRIIDDFPSRTHLIQAVVTACSFPFFAWRCRCGCPCEFDAGCQSILTPPDLAVDLTVRPMPLSKCCQSSAVWGELVPVTDKAARRIGHTVAFPSSLIPEGDAVWPGGRPPDFDTLRDLAFKARAQAADSPVVARAFGAKLARRVADPSSIQAQVLDRS